LLRLTSIQTFQKIPIHFESTVKIQICSNTEIYCFIENICIEVHYIRYRQILFENLKKKKTISTLNRSLLLRRSFVITQKWNFNWSDNKNVAKNAGQDSVSWLTSHPVEVREQKRDQRKVVARRVVPLY